MNNNKKDLRVAKTQKYLYDALVNLMKDRPFEEIKVSDICNEASEMFYSLFSRKFRIIKSLFC